MEGSKIIVQTLKEGQSVYEYAVKKDSSLTVVLVAIDVKNVDSSVTVKLQGAGAAATIIGIVVGQGDDNIKINTLQKHEAAGTTSNLLVKSALSGNARCIIDGGIRVEKKAQKTDAYQRNENLLLSETAYAESKPSLEILANDVRCTHGATVGPVSQEELWYLSTRGIPLQKAEMIVVEGFFSSALERVDDKQIRTEILQKVTNALQ
jgi:Fe-S cluster assembly protein SufD